jgi:uncharacterized membrane protein
VARARRGGPGEAAVPGGEAREPRRRPGGREGGDARRRAEQKAVVVGLLAAPGFTFEIARELADELPALLSRRFPGVEWRVELRPEPMAAASDADVDLIEVGHERMLSEGWELAVCLTDFPVHVGNRPVTAYASAMHGVGLVSVPALGAVKLRERVLDAVLSVIDGLLGESVDESDDVRDQERQIRMRRRLQELSSLELGDPQLEPNQAFRFVAAVGLGNLRLLLGMVRANRPWRLIAGLSRAIVGALGLDIFGVVSPGVWMIADGVGWVRLLLVAVVSIGVICATLITAHRLWRRTYDRRRESRARVVLFNLATALTVALGVLTLYLALLVINVLAALVVIPESVLAQQLRHPAGWESYVALSWLVTSLATLGGALGASLEHERAVREAAYDYRPDARNEALGGSRARSR